MVKNNKIIPSELKDREKSIWFNGYLTGMLITSITAIFVVWPAIWFMTELIVKCILKL